MIGLDKKKQPVLSKEAFNSLRDIIYKRCGIYFTENKMYLIETRLKNRLEALQKVSYDDYVEYLTYNGAGEIETRKMVDCIVTNETSFFRDIGQLDTFKSKILQIVMDEKRKTGDKTIRLWSAACSSGEEPYTLAMILAETVPINLGWRVEVFGSDISDVILEASERAVYSDYALRTTSELHKQKYFTKTGNVYQLKDTIKDMVKFKKVNLYSMFETRGLSEMDIIFCRNVLIYFNDYSKKKVISHLYDCLNKDGFLILGSAESLHSITRLFTPESFDRSIAYKKK